jgi:hypothetical protein
MRLLFALLFSICIYVSSAQRTQLPHGLWTSIGLGLKLNDKWTSSTDVGYRTYSADFIPYTNYYRATVRYNFSNRVNYGGGIAVFNQRTTFNRENKEYSHELRVYGELSQGSLKTSKGIFSQRWRLEQKYFQATSMKPAINYQRLSVRILGGYQITPVWNIQTGPEWYESFIRRKFTFDQMRWNLMTGVQLGSGFSLVANYFVVIKSTTYQNIFQVTFSKNLKLHDQHH